TWLAERSRDCGLALRLRRDDLFNGGDWRRDAALGSRSLDHGMAATHGRDSALERRGLGTRIRTLQGDSAISGDTRGHDAWGIQDDLLLGISAPALGPADRGRLRRAVRVVLAGAPSLVGAGTAARAALRARRSPGRARLVHGEERSRRSHRG